MKKIILITLLALGLQTMFAQPEGAANAPVRYTFNLKNGSVYTGTIISDDGREMFIQTETIGKLYVTKTDLRSMTKIDDKKAAEFEHHYQRFTY
jgi:hypothetical protein